MARAFLVASVLASAVWFAAPSASTADPITCKDWHIDQDWKLDQIDIAYIEPKDPSFSSIYQGLKDHQILEELKEFLSPLRLPKKLLIKTEECDQPNRPYQPDGPVTICYEYIAELAALVTKIPDGGTTARGVSRDDAMTGAFVQVVLHEVSHAVFDQLQVPVWGREEDAADKLAGFLMLQFGRETARKLLNGAAYFFEASDRTWTGSDFSDVKSTEAQRFYNYLCIAYGGDPKGFADFIQNGDASRADLLPARRVPWCAHEYFDFKFGFDNFIRPCLDRERFEKVHSRTDWYLGSGK